MTVDVETAKSGPYSGNDSTTVFAYAFKLLAEEHLVVTLKDSDDNETVQTITTHYSVSGVGTDGGGNCTMVTAPASGETLTLTRAVPLSQTTDLVNRGAVQPASLETAYDRGVQMVQDFDEEMTRALKLPVSTAAAVSPELPVPVADAFIKWDSAGTALESSSTTVGQWLGGNGTVSLPYYSFTSDPDTGFYRIGSGSVGIAKNGVTDGEVVGTTGTQTLTNKTLSAATITGATSVTGAVTVGVDGTGKDLKLFGDTSGAYVLWDESADKLLTAGAAVVDIVKDSLLIDGTAVTTTAAELNILDGVTSTAAELNILDGVTSTAAELNILDGVTSTAAELNILDGVTSTAAELNILDGVTSTAVELNYSDTGAAVGTVVASKVVTADANKDVASLRNITATELITGGSITLASGATITAVLDEDNMASNSATAGVTQQSLVAYVASVVTGAALWSDVAYKTNSDSPVAVADANVGTMYAVNASGGAVVVNLAAISTLSLGGNWAIGVKKTDTSANTVTINRGGSDTIDGGTSYILSNQAEGVTLIPDTDSSPDDWTSIASGPVFGSASVYQFTNTGSDSTASTTSNGGYNAGVSTTLTISQSPLSESNVHLLFDGVTQHHDTYSLSGAVITTSSAIPTGTAAVEVIVGETVAMGVPSDATVTSAKLSGNLTTPGTLTVNGEAIATGFTGTLDGVLGSGTPATAAVTELTLTTDLAVTHGGTGASNAAGARSNLSAAASGANSDITSLTGLTTDLTVAQGGTGAGTFADNGILYGNGTGAIAATAVGSATHVLTSNGAGVAPTFQAAAGGGDAVTLAGSLDYLTLSGQEITRGAIVLTTDVSGTLPVANGGSGATSLSEGGVLLGSGTGAITAMAVLADGEMIVGDGTGDPMAESGATLRTSIGVGTGDSPQFTAINVGDASDTTIARSGAGDITVEGNAVYRAGGTDVPVADGGTGASALTDGGILLGSGTGAITAMAVLANGEMIVGDGTGDPMAESGATLRTSIGVDAAGTDNSTDVTLAGSLDYLTLSGQEITRGAIVLSTDVSGTLPVANGGSGATSLSEGGVLLGNGTGAITAMAVLADGEMIVGDGTTDPVAESGATLRTSIGVDAAGTDNSTDVTLAGSLDYLTLSGQEITPSAIVLTTDVSGALPIANGGTNATSAGAALTSLGAAARGANSDITSITGLTTDLTVAQGGTGASTHTANSVLIGAGTSAITSVAPGTSGNVLTSNGSAWTSAAGGGGGGGGTGWSLIQTDDISSSITSLVIQEATSGAWDAFSQLKIVMTNLLTGTDNTRVKMSNDGGSTFGAWDQYSAIVYNHSGFKGSEVGWGQPYAYVFDSTFRANTGQKMLFQMDIFMDGNDICFSGRGDGADSGGDHCFLMTKGTGLALSAIDYIEFYTLAWTAGQVRLYGLTV